MEVGDVYFGDIRMTFHGLALRACRDTTGGVGLQPDSLLDVCGLCARASGSVHIVRPRDARDGDYYTQGTHAEESTGICHDHPPIMS